MAVGGVSGERLRRRSHPGLLQPQYYRTLRGTVIVGWGACLALAVLLFGGVEPRALTVIQASCFTLFVVHLWLPRNRSSSARLPWQGPCVLLALVLSQSFLLTDLNQYYSGQVLRLLLYVCTFLLFADIGGREKTRHRLIAVLVWIGFLEALYGTAVFLADSKMILYIKKYAYLDRASGTYVNPNHFAGLLALLLPLSMGLAFTNLVSLRRTRDPIKMNDYFWSAVMYFTIGLVLFIGIIVSQSRLGLLSVVSGMLAAGILTLAASWKRRPAAIALGVFLLLSLVAGLWIGVEPIVNRFEALETSYAGRRAIWADTYGIIQDNPILGAGLGSFRVEYTKHQSVYLEYLVDHAHNDYLQFAAEIGIPGAVLLFGMIVLVLVRSLLAVRRSKWEKEWLLVAGMSGSVIAMLVQSFGDFNMQIPANAMVFSAILGLLYVGAKPRASSVVELRSSRQTAD